MIAYIMMLGSPAMSAHTSPRTPWALSRARQNVIAGPPFRRGECMKMNERTGNVYENKGAAWKARQQSRNVYEKKTLNHYFRECY
jgi:hypothetical protein